MALHAAVDAAEHEATPRGRRAGLAKYVAWARVGAVVSATAAACSSGSDIHGADAEAIVEGVKGVPECCAPQTYVELPTQNCTGVDVSCPGGLAYSECLYGQFGPCQCTMPSDGGWMLAGTCTDAGVCQGPLLRWCDASDNMGVDVLSLIDTRGPIDAGEVGLTFDSGPPPDVSSMEEPQPADVHDAGRGDVPSPRDVASIDGGPRTGE
jgi:hypothetical protein